MLFSSSLFTLWIYFANYGGNLIVHYKWKIGSYLIWIRWVLIWLHCIVCIFVDFPSFECMFCVLQPSPATYSSAEGRYRRFWEGSTGALNRLSQSCLRIVFGHVCRSGFSYRRETRKRSPAEKRLERAAEQGCKSSRRRPLPSSISTRRSSISITTTKAAVAARRRRWSNSTSRPTMASSPSITRAARSPWTSRRGRPSPSLLKWSSRPPPRPEKQSLLLQGRLPQRIKAPARDRRPSPRASSTTSPSSTSSGRIRRIWSQKDCLLWYLS